MPIFEYRCGACGTEFETLLRASSPPPVCPDCHSSRLEKKLSGFAVASSVMESATADVGACGSCGHPGGPGACQFE
jgi:putative FmdB family regulatory protein